MVFPKYPKFFSFVCKEESAQNMLQSVIWQSGLHYESFINENAFFNLFAEWALKTDVL